MDKWLIAYRKEHEEKDLPREADKVQINLDNVKYIEVYESGILICFVGGGSRTLWLRDWDIQYF